MVGDVGLARDDGHPQQTPCNTGAPGDGKVTLESKCEKSETFGMSQHDMVMVI